MKRLMTKYGNGIIEKSSEDLFADPDMILHSQIKPADSLIKNIFKKNSSSNKFTGEMAKIILFRKYVYLGYYVGQMV